MKINVLVDNQDNADLIGEHGLSLYIESCDKRVLCDMGASDIFAKNALRLGVDLSKIDFGFISHAHSDHIGGLPYFLENYSDTGVYVSERVFSSRYYFSTRRETEHNLTPNFEQLDRFRNRLHRVNHNCWLTEGIAAVYCDCQEYSQPLGNSFLYKRSADGVVEKDNFDHEMALVFQESDGLVVISSCSHCGVVNILRSCCEFTGINRVKSFVGGLHLTDGEMVAEEVERLFKEIESHFCGVRIYTGHCTGSRAKELLTERLHAVKIFRTGDCIEI